MSQGDIDRYLAALDEPKRSTLEALRTSVLEVVPEAAICTLVHCNRRNCSIIATVSSDVRFAT